MEMVGVAVLPLRAMVTGRLEMHSARWRRGVRHRLTPRVPKVVLRWRSVWSHFRHSGECGHMARAKKYFKSGKGVGGCLA